jgi:hypothetical protein
MTKNELIRLIKSLSGSEKRNFKLYTKKQAGPKDYLDLFDIVNQTLLNGDGQSIEAQFKEKHPKKSFENTAHYLLKVTIDSLVHTRKEKDKWFQQYHSLMRSKVLFERSLSREGYKEIMKAQELSVALQDSLTYYHTCRLELNYWSDRSFAEKTEQDIVQMQMKAKSTLRLLHKIQEQSSLFDILRYRGIYAGKSLSSEDNVKLNDLLISELSLITRGTQQSFESQKLNLLFQSFYFINISDYKSSLKPFYDLNNLFENNESVWNFPPYDYLSTLEGILDSLRTIMYYDEMEYFINKVEILTEKKYPENFQIIARQTVYIYKLIVLINRAELHQAKHLADAIPPELLTEAILVDYEKLTELLFYIGIITYLAGDLKKANNYFSFITTIGKVNHSISVYKPSRLMHILIHYELDNMSYLDYEIRSYKRTFKKRGKALGIERLILLVIKFDPKRKGKLKNKLFWMKLAKVREGITHSKYEKQILKYFDFLNWVKEKLCQHAD